MEVDVPSSTNARSSATIDLTVDNFGQIQTEDVIFSDIVIVRNLPWRILVLKIYDEEGESNRSSSPSVGIFLQCNSESENSSWSCFAGATLSILSQRNDVKDFSRKIFHVFCAQQNDWGFSHFMSWDDVTNPKCGYIKDDAVMLRAEIIADPPARIAVASGLRIENIFVEECGTEEVCTEPEKACSDSEEVCSEEVDTDVSTDEMDCDESVYCTCKGETKILEKQLSQMKKDLETARSDSKTLSDALNVKSAELLVCQSTISTLQSKVEVLEEMLKSKLDVKSDELITTQSALNVLESKVYMMDEKLKAKVEEADHKYNISSNEPEKEKHHFVVDVNITVSGADSKSKDSKRYSF